MLLQTALSGLTSSAPAMALLAHALLLVLAFAPSAALAARDGWQNITVYRVTPIEDGGVLNMNTADAAGDVYFGLSQLLLPYMCGGETHVSLWCNNRKWLSGGNAWMVYRKFTIEARECVRALCLAVSHGHVCC